MIKWLIKKFIKNSENIQDNDVRNAYGMFGGIIGIITNIILSISKIIIGIVSGSLAISADGINNLSDAASSIVTLVGFKIASKPADEDHPYGHARVEYVAGLIVSFVILFIGVSLGKSSIEKIINPSDITFSYTLVIVLVLSILMKLWQGYVYNTLHKKIDSVALKASAKDSFNDCISTVAVLLSVIIFKLFEINLDGYFGILVSLFILKAGIEIVKDTINPLIGEKPDPVLIKNIVDDVLAFEGVLGVHDVMFHLYGANKVFTSLHAEVSAESNILESHDLIDNIEMAISEKYNIEIVIHMDPIDTFSEETKTFKKNIKEILESIDKSLKFHDLRVVYGATHTNVLFDIVVPIRFHISNSDIKKTIMDEFKNRGYENIFFIIKFDKEYTEYTM